MLKDDFEDVRFGTGAPIDWREVDSDENADDDDDEELAETPLDVSSMLGFDPLDGSDE